MIKTGLQGFCPDLMQRLILSLLSFQEVLVNGVFIPTVDLLSDPDYINSYIVWLVGSFLFIRKTWPTKIPV